LTQPTSPATKPAEFTEQAVGLPEDRIVRISIGPSRALLEALARGGRIVSVTQGPRGRGRASLQRDERCLASEEDWRRRLRAPKMTVSCDG
jgi:hypothetical protein